MNNNRLGQVIRTVIIILVGLTSAFNLLGGIGKVCAAFMTKDFPPLWALLDSQWLYQGIMVATALAGIAGIWTTIQLVRGGDHVLRNAIIVMGIAILITGVNVAASLSLRGKAAPSDMRMYFNIFVLAVTLLVLLPGVRDRVNFTRSAPPTDRLTSTGLAAITAGLGVLSVSVWAGPSHTYLGESWIDVLLAPLTLTGWGLAAGGAAALFAVMVSIYKQEAIGRSQAR